MKHLKTIALKDVILYTGLALLFLLAYKVLTDPNIYNFNSL